MYWLRTCVRAPCCGCHKTTLALYSCTWSSYTMIFHCIVYANETIDCRPCVKRPTVISWFRQNHSCIHCFAEETTAQDYDLRRTVAESSDAEGLVLQQARCDNHYHSSARTSELLRLSRQKLMLQLLSIDNKIFQDYILTNLVLQHCLHSDIG